MVCDCIRGQSCLGTRFGSLRGSQRPGDPDPHESAQLPTRGGGKGWPRGLAWHCSRLTVHPQIALSGPPFALCVERGSTETGAPCLAGGRRRAFFHTGTLRPSSRHSPRPWARRGLGPFCRPGARLLGQGTQHGLHPPRSLGPQHCLCLPPPCALPAAWLPPCPRPPPGPSLRAFAQAAALSQAFSGRQGSPDTVTAAWPCQTTCLHKAGGRGSGQGGLRGPWAEPRPHWQPPQEDDPAGPLADGVEQTRWGLDVAEPQPAAHTLGPAPPEVSLVSLPASDLAPLSRFSPACPRDVPGATGATAPWGQGLCPRTQHEADSRVRTDTLLREGWAPSSRDRTTSPLSWPWRASEARPLGAADLACPRPPMGGSAAP